MDPVTGLSRRARRSLIAVVALGVVASTAATIGGAEGGCPDERWGCSISHEGEDVVLGLVIGEDRPVPRPALPATFAGRALRTEIWRIPCTAAAGAEAARELGSDPLDAPSVFAVVLDACPEALLPAAQILGDVGLPAVVMDAPAALPPRARTALDASSLGSAGEAAVRVVEAASDLALTRDGDVLVPRTPLLRALAGELPRIPSGNLAGAGPRP